MPVARECTPSLNMLRNWKGKGSTIRYFACAYFLPRPDILYPQSHPNLPRRTASDDFLLLDWLALICRLASCSAALQWTAPLSAARRTTLASSTATMLSCGWTALVQHRQGGPVPLLPPSLLLSSSQSHWLACAAPLRRRMSSSYLSEQIYLVPP